MRINVSGLLKSALGANREYRIEDNIKIGDNDSLVRGGVSLVRTNRGILAKAKMRTEVEVTCCRCLKSFASPLEINFEDEFFPIIDVNSGAALSLPEESGCFTIDARHVIDLSEAVRQYILLVIPMKPLCREDCAGLCSTCGRNLNDEKCDCLVQEIDPRWSKLSKLL